MQIKWMTRKFNSSGIRVIIGSEFSAISPELFGFRIFGGMPRISQFYGQHSGEFFCGSWIALMSCAHVKYIMFIDFNRGEMFNLAIKMWHRIIYQTSEEMIIPSRFNASSAQNGTTSNALASNQGEEKRKQCSYVVTLNFFPFLRLKVISPETL